MSIRSHLSLKEKEAVKNAILVHFEKGGKKFSNYAKMAEVMTEIVKIKVNPHMIKSIARGYELNPTEWIEKQSNHPTVLELGLRVDKLEKAIEEIKELLK